MKERWLNLILKLTNRIFVRKQELLQKTGVKIIGVVGTLIFFEIVLAIVSLPLYITLRPARVTAYFGEHGGYAKATFDYNLRRILTLTGVSILLLFWILKLLLIILFPVVYGPLTLYTVSDLQPVSVVDQALVGTEVEIQTARVDPTLQKPELQAVHKQNAKDYNFSGVGPAGSTVVLLLSGQQTAVYTAAINAAGSWIIQQSHTTFNLADGNQSILVYTYNQALGTRSDVAPEQYFKVTTTWYEQLLNNIDQYINWTVVIIIIIGLFLTILTL